MDKLITEDILKQIILMKYDRSKTLLEQSVIGAPNKGVYDGRTNAQIEADRIADKKYLENRRKMIELEKKIVQNCDSLIKSKPGSESEKKAKKIFLILKNQIDSNGTKEQIILDALKLIDSAQTYMMLMVYIYGCYPQNYGMTILQFIQSQEFSLGANDPGGVMRKSQYWLGQEIQYQFNDYWLMEYEKILEKFNPDEYYQKEYFQSDDTDWEIVGKAALPPYTREVAHLLIPLLSLIMAIVPGTQGGSVTLMILLREWVFRSAIMFGLESVDAAIYKWGDKNDYTAGLSLIFAFAGPLDNALSGLIKLYGATLLQKVGSISKGLLTYEYGMEGAMILTKGELELLANVTMYAKRYTKLTRLGLARQVTKRIIANSSSNVVLKYVLKLMKFGMVTTKFTTRLGLTIGGGFYTWDAIAKNLGICNTLPLALIESDWLILKALAKTGKYIQPFTTPCDQEAAYNKLKTIRTDEDLFIDLLETAKKENKTYSTTYGYYNINVLIAQYVFYAAGLVDQTVTSIYSLKNNILTINNSEIIKNVSMYTSLGKLIKTINNNNNSKVLTYDFGNLKSVVIMKFTMFDNTIETGKLFVGAGLSETYNFKILGKPKWGVFDKPTERLVNIYQKQNGLSVDGKIGPETLSKLISDLKTKRYGKIENLNNEDFDKIRVAEVKAVYDEYLKQKDKLLIDEKMVLDALEKDKANRAKLADDAADAITNADEMSTEEYEEIFGVYKLPK
jgi:peptidoglycan hydrolase-like protein with peptidoglycan-binding domain